MSTNSTNSLFLGRFHDHLQTTMVAISITAAMECALEEVLTQLWHGIHLIGMGPAFKTIHPKHMLFQIQIKQDCRSLLLTAPPISGTSIVQGKFRWISCGLSGHRDLMMRIKNWSTTLKKILLLLYQVYPFLKFL